MRPEVKRKLCQLRRWRIRRKVSGTAERPRMSVKFSHQHIYVQFIDDTKGVTLASMSTRAKALAADQKAKLKANKDSAKVLGKLAAEAAKGKGITAAVFDRNGAKYHGKVKELADAARTAGLKL
jgi:large subunit ribosomal protein L18